MIRFSHVTKVYPNGAVGLQDVSFFVPKSQFVFLTGHSGAGKSTVLSLISAHERPTGGEVRVAGFQIGRLRSSEIPRLRRRLGIVFQDFRLLENRTAEENLAFALEVTGAPARTIPERVLRALAQVGLAGKARAYPRELSGGEQQRVAIARALATIFQKDPQPLVTFALTAEKKSVRLGVLRALDMLESPQALPALRRALQDPDAEVRHASVSALAKLEGAEARALLLSAVRDPDPQIRIHAARALWAADAHAYRSVLRTLEHDPVPEVREVVHQMLAERA
ncbi:MAG: ATP-binding cassette domain-containing protein [Dehalococcoidia bacterium]|nr:ATP-binding cassette domain-containing protein [Dehalococcoidia bacterium]